MDGHVRRSIAGIAPTRRGTALPSLPRRLLPRMPRRSRACLPLSAVPSRPQPAAAGRAAGARQAGTIDKSARRFIPCITPTRRGTAIPSLPRGSIHLCTRRSRASPGPLCRALPPAGRRARQGRAGLGGWERGYLGAGNADGRGGPRPYGWGAREAGVLARLGASACPWPRRPQFAPIWLYSFCKQRCARMRAGSQGPPRIGAAAGEREGCAKDMRSG